MKSIELLEQRAKLVSDARKILDACEQEQRDLSAEERQSWDALMQDADKLKEQADSEQRKEYQSQVEAELSKPQTRKVTPHKPAEMHDYDRYFDVALRSWALQGTPHCRFDGNVLNAASHVGINLNSPALNLRAMTKGTAADGGYTVPVSFVRKLNEALLYYAPIRNWVDSLTTDSGQDLDYPKVDNTALTASIIAEGSEKTEDTNPTFSKVTLKAWKYVAFRKCSIELLQDSAFDLQSWIAKALGEMVGRSQEAHFVTGDNSSKPQGIVPASALGKDLNGSALASDDVIDLIHSIDVAYRMSPKCAFIMSDEVLSDVRKLKDDNNQYLWQPGMQAGVPDRLFGYPIHISNSVEDGDSADEKFMVFGDLSQYLVRDVNSVELIRSNERYIEFGQVAFYVFLRSDGRLVGPSASIKHLLS